MAALYLAVLPLSVHVGVAHTGRPCAVSMFAAKSKKVQPSSAAGGFGATKPPPPTLDEVCASFPTRLPSDVSACCPCGTGEPYEACCRPYHLGERVAETAERCLRSRYTGFCFRLPKYIIGTTSKSNSDWQEDKVKWARRLSKEQMFDSFRFESLEIMGHEEGGERESFVDMRVTLQPIDAKTKLKTQAEPMVFNEKSRFTQTAKGAWLYASGAVTSDIAGLKNRVLNSEDDLGKLRSDVEFVEGAMKQAKKKK